MQKTFIQIQGVPFSVLILLFRVGSRNDPASQEGITHLVEHLVSTPLEDGSAFLKKTRTLERNGILFQAITTKEYTAYICIQPKEKTQMGLDYLMKHVIGGTCTDVHITQEKKVVLQELRDEYSDIDKSLFDGACEGLWPHSTLAHPVAGSVSSLKKITAKNIREYLAHRYTHENTMLVLLGDEDIFQGDARQTDEKQQRPDVEVFKPVQPIVFKDHITLGNRLRIGMYFRTVHAHKKKERAVLSIIADLLAGYRSSLLNQTLRVDSALTYWVSQYVEYFRDAGLAGFEFSTASKDALEALNIVQAEIDALATKLQKDSVIHERIDTRLSEMVRESHNPHVLADWYIDECLYMKGVGTFEDYATMLKSITPQNVRDVVRTYLKKENRTVVVVGTPSTAMRKKMVSAFR